eukprot:CAMPEP_0184318278 /NCGR_PEP_ID=MMETSP1049-20130417/101666_1 /TAXON_ID=77928 /ORGANISM="Proteomonas sulcata, Strain CCMP704" /LENGTH=73 /DNA_ID=CAMNT_0026637989 /DNA_START=336 /DNA_END=557 /DNA_ORIENTATION=+
MGVGDVQSANQAASQAASQSAQVAERKLTGRELWLKEVAEENARSGDIPPPIEVGDKPMCSIGGCGYFSDDDK